MRPVTSRDDYPEFIRHGYKTNIKISLTPTSFILFTPRPNAPHRTTVGERNEPHAGVRTYLRTKCQVLRMDLPKLLKDRPSPHRITWY